SVSGISERNLIVQVFGGVLRCGRAFFWLQLEADELRTLLRCPNPTIEPVINSGSINLAAIICVLLRLFVLVLEQHAGIRVVKFLQGKVSYGLVAKNNWIGIAEAVRDGYEKFGCVFRQPAAMAAAAGAAQLGAVRPLAGSERC